MENSVQMKQSIIISFFIWCHILLSQILKCLVAAKKCDTWSIMTFVYWNGSCQALLRTLSKTQISINLSHFVTKQDVTYLFQVSHLESFQFMSQLSDVIQVSHICTFHTLSHIVTYCHMSHIVTFRHFCKKKSQNLTRFWWHFLSQFSLLSH